MKHYFVILKNKCICDFWAFTKDEVKLHFRRNTIKQILEVY